MCYDKSKVESVAIYFFDTFKALKFTHFSLLVSGVFVFHNLINACGCIVGTSITDSVANKLLPKAIFWRSTVFSAECIWFHRDSSRFRNFILFIFTHTPHTAFKLNFDSFRGSTTISFDLFS